MQKLKMRSMYLLLLVVLVVLGLRAVVVVFVWLVLILTGAAVASINMMHSTTTKARMKFIVAIIPIHDYQRDMSIASQMKRPA